MCLSLWISMGIDELVWLATKRYYPHCLALCSMHRKCPYSAGDTDVFCQNKCSRMPLLWDMKIEYHFKINVLIPEIKISMWIMDEWWELDDRLRRPVALWSLHRISQLIRKLSIAVNQQKKRWMEGKTERRMERWQGKKGGMRGCRNQKEKDGNEIVSIIRERRMEKKVLQREER